MHVRNSVGTFGTFGTLGTISKKINKFILCFASIVFIPPPFHISPVSRGRATFYYLGLLGDKVFALGKAKINKLILCFALVFVPLWGDYKIQ